MNAAFFAERGEAINFVERGIVGITLGMRMLMSFGIRERKGIADNVGLLNGEAP